MHTHSYSSDRSRLSQGAAAAMLLRVDVLAATFELTLLQPHYEMHYCTYNTLRHHFTVYKLYQVQRGRLHGMH